MIKNSSHIQESHDKSIPYLPYGEVASGVPFVAQFPLPKNHPIANPVPAEEQWGKAGVGQTNRWKEEGTITWAPMREG